METGGERSRGRGCLRMPEYRRKDFYPSPESSCGGPGLEDELFLVPVVVVDVGAVEALDRLGGATAGFDGLEDAEGDEDAAAFVVQAVRIDDDGGPPARGSLPGGLAATLVRALSLFQERLIPAHREKLRSNQ